MAFPPMPTGSQPELTLKEFILRALCDEANSVATTPVTVLGSIAGAGQGRTSGYTVARVSINCCAADANPMRIYLAEDPPYPQNTWVKVVVTAIPDTGTLDNEYVPQATILTMELIEQPATPYMT